MNILQEWRMSCSRFEIEQRSVLISKQYYLDLLDKTQ